MKRYKANSNSLEIRFSHDNANGVIIHEVKDNAVPICESAEIVQICQEHIDYVEEINSVC